MMGDTVIVENKGEPAMQITTLLGSAHKKGNTATVLNWVEAELATLGHSVERIYLNGKTKERHKKVLRAPP